MSAGKSDPGVEVEQVPPGGSIRVETGFYEGLEWPLDRPKFVVGRGRQADLALSEATMSRTHAALVYTEGEWFVEDLGSTNGTLLNGTRTSRAPVRSGDEVQLGRLILRVLFKEEVAVA